MIKTSVAVILAWLVSSLLLNQPFPTFAAIAALLVVLPSVNQSVARGIERTLGVVLGVIIATIGGMLFGPQGWVVLSVIVVCLFLGWGLKLRPSAASQIAISGLLVLATGSHTPGYAVDRIIETIIGAAVAMIVNFLIVPPVLLLPAHVAVARLLRECVTTLEFLALCLGEVQDSESLHQLMVQARSLRRLDAGAVSAVATAEESLTLNPRRGRNRRVLERDIELLGRLSILARRLVGMARAIRDHYDPSLHDEPSVQDIARELTRAAHDLRLLGQDDDGTATPEPRDAEDSLPALTRPLQITRPHPTHWVLIGSLLEDIRRVREEIIGVVDD